MYLKLKSITPMKKILSLIALIFIFNSCSTDDGQNYTLKLFPVESVDIPTEFTSGNTYPITIHYKKTSTCDYFNTIYYEKNSNVRTIAVEMAVLQRNDCEDLTGDAANAQCSFNFVPTTASSYIFKFWQGKDTSGNDIFLEYEVPVN